ncbi:UDP-N-acetylmuramate dehydrogenase [Marinobacterium stanieri]|uniref:UDP-N-acetylmuramate dehydrogenase n=1 Tax=Marinobacterium stanieri TaxID=49186 RepID=UPI003A95D156
MTSLPFQFDISLAQCNTLGLPARAERFLDVTSIEQLSELESWLKQEAAPLLVLGGGSNLVLSDDLPGVVAHIAIRGWELMAEQDAEVLLKVGAGENWHQTVARTLESGYFGLENLALIPGTVGAAPIQNIGAYGVELKDRLRAVEVFDRHDQSIRQLSNAECRFGYRDSIFKSGEPERYIITAVELALNKTPDLQLDYGGLREALSGIDAPGPLDVFDAVCRVRRSKLPDPAELGNAGSFFKNPLVHSAVYERIRADYPDLVAFPEADGRWKLAAGWLIDRCGLKGARDGSVGTYPRQALVLVNWGGARRADVEHFSSSIREAVLDRFGVELEPEPRFYP